MRLTQYYVPTLRDDPAEADVASHRLLSRAGMIRRVAAGVYSFLPLGQRVLAKVMKVVREELAAAGAIEVLLPVLMPAELWQETGRWSKYGPEMMRLKDRHERDFCLGPTHEEAIVDLVRGELKSYRDLPLNLYQIQVKFRDEPRPRFGLLRGREFIMKDAYSFDRDESAMQATYQVMYDAYGRIMRRMGLDFRAVEAATGLIGGDVSHEFMVLASSGEDLIFYCADCDYAANREVAKRALRGTGASHTEGPSKAPESSKVHTPGVTAVEDVAAFLGVEPSALAKTMLFKAGGSLVAVVTAGDREVSPAKLGRYLGEEPQLLAEDEARARGLAVGFVGPVGLDGARLLADAELAASGPVVVGANEDGFHILNALPAAISKPPRLPTSPFRAPGTPVLSAAAPCLRSMGSRPGRSSNLERNTARR